jgi:hypothetical protein
MLDAGPRGSAALVPNGNSKRSAGRCAGFRWVVERSPTWIVAFRRLALRYDRQAGAVLGFLYLA